MLSIAVGLWSEQSRYEGQGEQPSRREGRTRASVRYLVLS